ncbi:hypothetical protein GGS20DRAFT_583011 [Poronia punctata]|nr:hypothetical protein GGS20DRAFT_583011 [Poronia punctata]
MFFAALCISLLAFANQAYAVSWYFLRYYPASGQRFTSFSGNLVTPNQPNAATIYVWPGLQPTDNSGVYQNVMDGRSGTCVAFRNELGGSTWTSTLTRSSTGETASDNFALSSKSFNQALFAIELYDVPWNFGQVSFTNVVITSSGSGDSSWCNDRPENYNGATVYSIQGNRYHYVALDR